MRTITAPRRVVPSNEGRMTGVKQQVLEVLEQLPGLHVEL